ncbi:MAG: hypothetical protein ACHQQQ_14565 [Bacteroidota bacterium]
MARKLYYKINQDGRNAIAADEWEEIIKLEHWYNSEFMWTAGKLAFKMYAVFPNFDHPFVNEDELWNHIITRRKELREAKHSEDEIIKTLEYENLIIAKKGGYFDGCLASGFTRVAANEWNAYLVCEFLLHASRILKNAAITVIDEGEFIKPKFVLLRSGRVLLQLVDTSKTSFYETMIANKHVFSVVDSAKYDKYPTFKTTISDFNELDINERRSIVNDWHWLGFENDFDLNGDDIQGYDLNKKVEEFTILRYDKMETDSGEGMRDSQQL